MTRRTRGLRRLGVALGGAALGLAVVTAQATEVRHWKREPITVQLPVGAERIVVFGDPVRVGLPQAIADPDVLRVQSTGGAVYFKAKKPFDTQRVQIQDMRTGRLMLFDLAGVAHGSHETLRIEDDAGSSDHAKSSNAGDTHPAANYPPAPPEAFGRGGSSGAPQAVRLVRHAAQALYAPLRLVDPAQGIHRVAVNKHTVNGLLPAYPVTARPLAAWRGGPYTVTAIEITNQDSRRAFNLDPRNLAGDFYAASFMHDTVGPAGTSADTTTLFAVTKNADLTAALFPPIGDQEADDAH